MLMEMWTVWQARRRKVRRGWGVWQCNSNVANADCIIDTAAIVWVGQQREKETVGERQRERASDRQRV